MDLSVGSKREKKRGAFAVWYTGIVQNMVMLKGWMPELQREGSSVAPPL